MSNLDNLREFAGVAGAPVVAGLVQLVKAAWPDLPSRWWPLLAVVWGVVWNVALALEVGLDLGESALWGVVTGLLASGLFSLAKAVGKAPKAD